MMVASPRGRAARLRRMVSERDLAILGSLYQLRLLTAKQVQRLYVVDEPLTTQVRRTQVLLKRLHEQGLVVRLSRVIGGLHAGSTGYIYGLSGLGYVVLDVPGRYGKRRRGLRDTKPYFQDHVLAVAEVFVCLVEGARRRVYDLLAFEAEPWSWRYFGGTGGESIVLKPDAYVRIGTAAVEYLLFIEVDLASESLPVVYRKCLRYVAYWRTGVEQGRQGVFPRVLWLVPDERRRVGIMAVVGKLAAEARGLFRAGLLDEVVDLVAMLEGEQIVMKEAG